MSIGLFLAWVIVMALALASYAWLAAAMLGASSIPSAWKWSIVLPPLALFVAFRAGGWPRAAGTSFSLLAVAYLVLRWLA